MLHVLTRKSCLVAMLALMPIAQNAQASSPDAWEEFQQNVEKSCLRAAEGMISVKRIQVDPYGSETYGFAVLFGTEIGTETEVLIACAYDKAAETAEISSPFDR